MTKPATETHIASTHTAPAAKPKVEPPPVEKPPAGSAVTDALVELMIAICDDMFMHGHSMPEDSKAYEVLKAYAAAGSKKK